MKKGLLKTGLLLASITLMAQVPMIQAQESLNTEIAIVLGLDDTVRQGEAIEDIDLTELVGIYDKYKVMGLPEGLEFNDTIISGVPKYAGVYRVNVITTNDEGHTKTHRYDLEVVDENGNLPNDGEFEYPNIEVQDVWPGSGYDPYAAIVDTQELGGAQVSWAEAYDFEENGSGNYNIIVHYPDMSYQELEVYVHADNDEGEDTETDELVVANEEEPVLSEPAVEETTFIDETEEITETTTPETTTVETTVDQEFENYRQSVLSLINESSVLTSEQALHYKDVVNGATEYIDIVEIENLVNELNATLSFDREYWDNQFFHGAPHPKYADGLTDEELKEVILYVVDSYGYEDMDAIVQTIAEWYPERLPEVETTEESTTYEPEYIREVLYQQTDITEDQLNQLSDEQLLLVLDHQLDNMNLHDGLGNDAGTTYALLQEYYPSVFTTTTQETTTQESTTETTTPETTTTTTQESTTEQQGYNLVYMRELLYVHTDMTEEQITNITDEQLTLVLQVQEDSTGLSNDYVNDYQDTYHLLKAYYPSNFETTTTLQETTTQQTTQQTTTQETTTQETTTTLYTHVERQTRTEDVGYATEYKENKRLKKGEQRVAQEGVNGQIKITEDVTFINDIEVSRSEVNREVVKEPETQIIEIGSNTNTLGEDTETIEVPFKTEVKENAELYEGTQIVLREGQNGQQKVTYTVVKDENGNLLAKTERSREVIKESVNKVVAVGTRKKQAGETTTQNQPNVTNLAQNTQYTPLVKNIITLQNQPVDASEAVTNKEALPKGTKYTWFEAIDWSVPGEKSHIVRVTYPDGTIDESVVTVTIQAVANPSNKGDLPGTGTSGLLPIIGVGAVALIGFIVFKVLKKDNYKPKH